MWVLGICASGVAPQVALVSSFDEFPAASQGKMEIASNAFGIGEALQRIDARTRFRYRWMTTIGSNGRLFVHTPRGASKFFMHATIYSSALR